MLCFIDRSIRKYVAEDKGYMVIIEKDIMRPGKWKFSIYKDTITALWWEIISEKLNISSLDEAKKRAQLIYNEILKNN